MVNGPWLMAKKGGGGALPPVKASFGNWRRALETVWQDLETRLQDLETGLQDLETGISPRIWKLVRRALETGTGQCPSMQASTDYICFIQPLQ